MERAGRESGWDIGGGGQDATRGVRGGEPARLGAVVGKSKLILMSNPYESPQANPHPPEPTTPTYDPPNGLTLRVNRACSIAIGLVASPIAAMFLIGAVGSYLEGRITWFGLTGTTAIGVSLLVGGVRSFMGRIDGVGVTAVVAALLLVWIGFAWFDASAIRHEFIDADTARWILTIAAQPWLLILFLAAVILILGHRTRRSARA